MIFKIGETYTHEAKGKLFKWQVLDRTTKTVTVKRTKGIGDVFTQSLKGDVFTKHINTDSKGIEFFTFKIIMRGAVYSTSKIKKGDL